MLRFLLLGFSAPVFVEVAVVEMMTEEVFAVPEEVVEEEVFAVEVMKKVTS
ncbi:hypothetical protein [Candidatus Methanodesulfokora washburnensis]|jgi:hypothetical protein|uniref:hypothetical protein n=1 Tax=Candidatus Methanodesulfokora washburnensis TaxID=2478471 RepID=UPI00138731DC|nr:hypothetical protein [Candidatus Methanodesulfokores washburnensis]